MFLFQLPPFVGFPRVWLVCSLFCFPRGWLLFCCKPFFTFHIISYSCRSITVCFLSRYLRASHCLHRCSYLTSCLSKAGVTTFLRLEPTARRESDMELNNNIISYIFIHSFHVSGDSVGLRCLAFNWCAHCGLPGAHQHRVGGFWSKSYWP